MPTTQLRRYEIESGKLDEFLAWWPSVLPAREKYGFSVGSAYADHEHSQFVWTVTHEGDEADFKAAEQRYLQSPERAQAFETHPDVIQRQTVALVRVMA